MAFEYRYDSGDEDTATRPFEQEGRRTVKFGQSGTSNIGLGKPLETEDYRDFTVKAYSRPAPPPPTAINSTSSTGGGDLENFPPRPTTPPLHGADLSRSNTTPSSWSPTKLANSTTSRHRQSSSTSSLHAPIPEPSYPVRSQPVHGHRSSSSIDVAMSPTISGGLAKRLSVSSLKDQDDDEENAELDVGKPIKLFRSESLPTFPPAEVLELRNDEEKRREALRNLPSNPKRWLPSHLAVYLADALRLHPFLQDDITAFVRTTGIGGRVFLRLRPSDLEEMGINVRWRPLLNEARERLRKETLSGQMWGFEGARQVEVETPAAEKVEPLAEPVETVTPYDTEEEEVQKEEWKKSWKGMKGNGRVKGLAQAWEFPTSAPQTPVGGNRNERSPSPSRRHSRTVFPRLSPRHLRSSSTHSSASSASIDSGSCDAPEVLRADSPFSVEDEEEVHPFRSPDTSLSSPEASTRGSYQKNIKEHSRPYQLVRRPSERSAGRTPKASASTIVPVAGYNSNSTMVRGPDNRMSVRELEHWSPVADPSFPSTAEHDFWGDADVEDGDVAAEDTVRTNSQSRTSRQANPSLSQMFGLGVRGSEGAIDSEEEIARVLEMDKNEMLSLEVRGRHGVDRRSSMVWVKRSQLEELQQRLDEVESKLQDVVASSRPSTSMSHYNDDHGYDGSMARPTNPTLGGWILQSFAAVSVTPSVDGQGRYQPSEGPLSWTALGGYCVAASIGIGIVAGEVVVSKLFGMRGRR